jgi:uncharacterized protein YndB with AHSA1/START domain
MSEPTKSIVVERVMPHPPEKVWRAMTQAAMISEWLMPNDFGLKVGHRFQFRSKPMPGWKGITNCEVKEVEPNARLVYSWGDGTESDSGLKTMVTWTLSTAPGGTLVRMEHSGFRPEDENGYRAMGGGWPGILGRLEGVVAKA